MTDFHELINFPIKNLGEFEPSSVFRHHRSLMGEQSEASESFAFHDKQVIGCGVANFQPRTRDGRKRKELDHRHFEADLQGGTVFVPSLCVACCVMEIEIREENRVLLEAHPEHWELLLAVDRLEVPLDEILRNTREHLPVPSSESVAFEDSATFVSTKIDIFLEAITGLQSALQFDLPSACGPPETPGHLPAILAACDLILGHCRRFANAEWQILHTPLHPSFSEFQRRVAGLTTENIGEIRRLVTEMRKAVEEDSTGTVRFQVHFTTEGLEGLKLESPSAQTLSVGESKPASSSGCGCLGLIGILLLLGVLALVAPWWAILIFLGLCILAVLK